ncbi:hypothetical protein AABB24_029789 [Solanum stoloniferum]|uniref:Uncharacterized protein n=1 Tax=Solanum stoloniferum TaxID=62892 RepID=A0ABD2RZG1_9SOLN
MERLQNTGKVFHCFSLNSNEVVFLANLLCMLYFQLLNLPLFFIECCCTSPKSSLATIRPSRRLKSKKFRLNSGTTGVNLLFKFVLPAEYAIIPKSSAVLLGKKGLKIQSAEHFEFEKVQAPHLGKFSSPPICCWTFSSCSS